MVSKKINIALGIAIIASGFSIQAATIEQTVQFDGTTPERLYEIYLNSEEHSAFTQHPAKIDARESGEFDAFKDFPITGRYGVTGKIFQLVPGRLVVQSWRGIHDNLNDLDSTLVLTFRKNEAGAEIELVQSNVPDEFRALVNTSWNIRYWTPLREYLKNESKRRR
jgi:hypothetical protein